MTKKVYRTAQGKTVDMGALLLQNEHVRAVGNMNVNARGDLLDSKNRVIDAKNKQVQRQYRRQTNVSSTVPVSSKTALKKAEAEIPVVQESFDDFADMPVDDVADLQAEELKQTKSSEAPVTEEKLRGGLAEAIAKAKQIKQEPLKTPRQLAQQSGVKKI